jgi:hypothetical protein
VTELVEGLEQRVNETIQDIFEGTGVEFNVEKITDPLTDKIDEVLGNLTKSITGDLEDLNCGDPANTRRFLEESATDTSLADRISTAIDTVNEALDYLGITITGDVTPYFDSKTFSAGVTTTLSVKFEQSAAGIIDILGDFFDEATVDVEKLGIGADDSMPSSAPSLSQAPSLSLSPTYEYNPSSKPSFTADPTSRPSSLPSFEPSRSSPPSISFKPSVSPSGSNEPSKSANPSVSLVPTLSPNALSIDFDQLLSKLKFLTLF